MPENGQRILAGGKGTVDHLKCHDKRQKVLFDTKIHIGIVFRSKGIIDARRQARYDDVPELFDISP